VGGERVELLSTVDPVEALACFVRLVERRSAELG
jgi:hypothetical protein